MSNRGMITTAPSYQRLVAASLAMLAFVACEDPKTFVPSHTDVFTYDTGQEFQSASAIYQADYLFILDYSSSMTTKKNNLLDRMGHFVDKLAQADNQYRIGFVKGNFHGCPGGTAPCSAKLTANDFVHSKFLEPVTSSSLFDQILVQVETLGDPNALPPNVPVQLEALRNTLKAKGSNFLRSSAQLIVVFMSDQDDESNKHFSNAAVDTYVNYIKSLKPDASYISARAFVAGGAGCALQNQGGLDPDVAGTRLAEAALKMNGNPTENAQGKTRGCIYNDSDMLIDALARDVQHYPVRFALEQKPILSTLSIQVNNLTTQAESDWVYNAATNEIIFDQNSPNRPTDGVPMKISYEVAYALKAKPKVETISVFVAGQSLAQSNSNGWSYEEAGNRILFHGSGRPSENAEIRVNYHTR